MPVNTRRPHPTLPRLRGRVGWGTVAPVAQVLQAEHEKHRRRRSVFQLRRQRNDILRLTRAHQYGDILLAVHRIAYRRGIDAGADIEGPQFPERFRVVNTEAAVHVAEENQISRGCQQTCIVRIGEFQCCLGLAGGRIDRFDAAVETVRSLRSAAGEAVARLGRAALVRHVLLLDGLDVVAAFNRGNVDEAEFRIVGARLPVLAAGNRRAQFFAFRLGAGAVAALVVNLHIGVWVVIERPAGLRIETGRPVQLVDILLAGNERSVDTVERVEETIARRMNNELAVLAVDLGVDDRVLGDLIVIVRVVGGILVAPLDLAVGRADRQDAGRPLVVAGAIFGVPVGARITHALIERISIRVVSGGLPDRSPAVLPALLAILPGLVAGFARARDRVGAPGGLAGVEVGRLDEAANAEFAARSAHDGKVADDQRRDGERLADGRVRDLAFPDHFAGRLVDGEHAPIERDGNHLVLPQRHAAVVDPAAGDVAGPGAVGAGIHLPLDDALLAGSDIDRINRTPPVRHVHDAVLDDRGCFEVAEGIAPAALESAERNREHRLEVFDGVGVDLLE